MFGPLTSKLEWEIQRAVYRLRKARGESPPKPHRVRGDPKAVIPDGLLVGTAPDLDQPRGRTLKQGARTFDKRDGIIDERFQSGHGNGQPL
jgi:hypothetical protein